MVMICQNTDLGDGWGRAAGFASQFRKKALMGINIVFYAMTH
jgi:hypothetical protein